MACECSKAVATTAAQRQTLRVALMLNAVMFAVGAVVGLWAQSTGVLADALDMLTDAIAFGLALMGMSRGQAFKNFAARWSAVILLALGIGIVAEAGRRWFFGSEPLGLAMMGYSILSLGVNVYVLKRLSGFQRGEVHLRAAYIFTHADVVANVAVFVAGGVVAASGWQIVDLVVGVAIGLYVVKEAIEIFRQTLGADATGK